ncbi:hypothetical protein A5N78_21530 [Prescottella equi]|nr:hypothetical protein A6I91_22195 [Prescottella equi]ORL85873.1 hypothetical protein A5N78_21530 [Prescottella equi]ORM12247.1 hypothetical protein A5N70_21290 [Prescottella equi]
MKAISAIPAATTMSGPRNARHQPPHREQRRDGHDRQHHRRTVGVADLPQHPVQHVEEAGGIRITGYPEQFRQLTRRDGRPDSGLDSGHRCLADALDDRAQSQHASCD